MAAIQEQSERLEDSSDPTRLSQSWRENFSTDEQIEIFSNRGLSQLLPVQLQNELAEQHIIIQRSSNPELGTQEIELQTLELEEISEAEASSIVEYEEQVPEDAVEVTVWSSVDETSTNQDHIHYGSREMVNLCSLSNSGNSCMQYAVAKQAVVVSREKDSFSRELFSQEEVLSPFKPASREQVVRMVGATQTVYTVDVVTAPSVEAAGSSLSLFSAPSSGEQHQQQADDDVAALLPSSSALPELPVLEAKERQVPTAAKNLTAKPIPISSVIPPKPLFSLPSFLTNLSSLVASAAWFKKTPRKRDRRDMVQEEKSSPKKLPRVMEEAKYSQAFATESDTEAEMAVTYEGCRRMEELSSCDDEDDMEVGNVVAEMPKEGEIVINGTEVLEPVGPEVTTADEPNSDFVEVGVATLGSTEREEEREGAEKTEVEEEERVEESLNTLLVDVEGSCSPRKLVIVTESTKDSTGNITMGTPQYSQPPFQLAAVSVTEAMRASETSATQVEGAESRDRRGGGAELSAGSVVALVTATARQMVGENQDYSDQENTERDLNQEEEGVVMEDETEREMEVVVEESVHEVVTEASMEDKDRVGSRKEVDEEQDEISTQSSQEYAVNAAFISSPSTTTVDTGQSDATGSTRKDRRRKPLKRKLRLSSSATRHNHFQSVSSSKPTKTTSPSSSSSCTLPRPTNSVPREIAAIIHATYMSAAMHNSRFSEPSLTDMWRTNSTVSSSSSPSSFCS